MHANGGIINGGVACVCAKWCVFVHFCACLRFFLCISVRLSYQDGLQKSAKFAQNFAKCAKKRFYAIPSPRGPIEVFQNREVKIAARQFNLSIASKLSPQEGSL